MRQVSTTGKDPDRVYKELYSRDTKIDKATNSKIDKATNSTSKRQSLAEKIGIYRKKRKKNAKPHFGPFTPKFVGDGATWYEPGCLPRQGMIVKAAPKNWYTLELGDGKLQRVHAIALGPGVGPEDEAPVAHGPVEQFVVGQCVTYEKPGYLPRQATVTGRAPGDCYTIDMGEGQTPHVHACTLVAGVPLALLDSLLDELDLAGLFG